MSKKMKPTKLFKNIISIFDKISFFFLLPISMGILLFILLFKIEREKSLWAEWYDEFKKILHF